MEIIIHCIGRVVDTMLDFIIQVYLETVKKLHNMGPVCTNGYAQSIQVGGGYEAPLRAELVFKLAGSHKHANSLVKENNPKS